MVGGGPVTAPSHKKRVAVYARVSSDNQRERASILTQTEALARHLEADPDVEVVGRYIDDGVSGTVPLTQRPDGARLMADAFRGRFDDLWVYRVDRLGRDNVDPILVRKQFEQLGIRIVSLQEGIDDDFMYAIRVACAAKERKDFLQRSADGTNRAAREGRPLGSIVALGFRVVGTKSKAVYEIDDSLYWGDKTAADIVRWIYDLASQQQWSCRRIADYLNQLGVPTLYQRECRGTRKVNVQMRWRQSRIRKILTNPAYRGQYRFGVRSAQPGREVIEVEGAMPRLVSDSVWDAVQRALAQNRVAAKRRDGRPYLLRSLMKCAICGLAYCGSTHPRGGIWYRCTGKDPHRGTYEGKCPSKMIKGAWLEPIIWADIERFLRDPGELIEELTAQADRSAEQAAREAERQSLVAALQELATRRERAIDLQVRGRISDGEFDRQAAQIEDERQGLDTRLGALLDVDEERHDAPLPADLLRELRLHLDEGLVDEGLDEDTRRQIIQSLVQRIVVYTDRANGGKPTARVSVMYRFPSEATLCVGPDCPGRGSSRLLHSHARRGFACSPWDTAQHPRVGGEVRVGKDRPVRDGHRDTAVVRLNGRPHDGAGTSFRAGSSASGIVFLPAPWPRWDSGPVLDHLNPTRRDRRRSASIVAGCRRLVVRVGADNSPGNSPTTTPAGDGSNHGLSKPIRHDASDADIPAGASTED
jgi:site-specific DNA recombinase